MSTIYQVSDLAGSRRVEFVNDARQGVARLRDKDGTSLVMLPESRLDYLEQVKSHVALFFVAKHCATAGTHLDVGALGANAWLRSLPVEDLLEFSNELGEALVAASADDSADLVDQVVEAWRVTARQLDDPLRREILLASGFDESSFVAAAQPDASEVESTI